MPYVQRPFCKTGKAYPSRLCVSQKQGKIKQKNVILPCL